MAVLFLFFCSSLLIDVVHVALRGTARIVRKSPPDFMTTRYSFFIASGLALAICMYGYFSALTIRTERLKIETAKLPANVNSLKIVQISDVHLGLIVRSERLKKIVEIVKAEKPDIFVSTGDLVDAQINHMTGMSDLLLQINAPYGNYAITGNHEFYAGIKQALAFTREAGFILLRGEAIKNVINIVGVDDPAAGQFGLQQARSEAELLSSVSNNRFTLLLKHRPSVDPDAAKLFDLQLSGHTHRGQIFPFTYISKLAYPMNAGRFDLSTGAILRVSRGTGTWGPPVRFLSPPEITVIELIRKVN
jgi:predicted MPP superfamily phosphohydrolase